jgi:hypothetical protein
MKTGLALDIEPGDPTMGALARDPHRSSDMSDRHLLFPDPLHEQQPAVERQPGVTVTHEDLLDCGDGNPHSTGGLRLRQQPVTNVLAGYT